LQLWALSTYGVGTVCKWESALMGNAAYEFCSSDGVCRLVRPSSHKSRPGIQMFTSHSWGERFVIMRNAVNGSAVVLLHVN
jgi:hypothetical protein